MGVVMSDIKQEIKVSFPQELQGGRYANNMNVTHSKEEFIMDYIMVVPPAGAVTARVIVSPGHMKRIISTLVDNVRKYEEKFGAIEETPAPMGKVEVH
jgi:hypothetical protein